jgi:hypothetical protein
MHPSECIVNSVVEEETMDVTMINVDLGAGDNKTMEVVSPNDQDSIRLIYELDTNKDNRSGEQIDVTQFMMEVENSTKGRTAELIIIKPIEKKSAQQAIELQDVVVYNNVEGKTLETTIEKVETISELQATEYKKDTVEGHVHVEEVTGVQGDMVAFQKSYEGSYIIQILMITVLYELQDGKDGKDCGLFNLKHQKLYFEIKSEEEDWKYWKIRPPKQKKELEDSRRVNYTEDPATLGNDIILI